MHKKYIVVVDNSIDTYRVVQNITACTNMSFLNLPALPSPHTTRLGPYSKSLQNVDLDYFHFVRKLLNQNLNFINL